MNAGAHHRSMSDALARVDDLDGEVAMVVVLDKSGSMGTEQMGFAKDDDVIQAFSADRANQPLHMAILPG